MLMDGVMCVSMETVNYITYLNNMDRERIEVFVKVAKNELPKKTIKRRTQI